MSLSTDATLEWLLAIVSYNIMQLCGLFNVFTRRHTHSERVPTPSHPMTYGQAEISRSMVLCTFSTEVIAHFILHKSRCTKGNFTNAQFIWNVQSVLVSTMLTLFHFSKQFATISVCKEVGHIGLHLGLSVT